ncbi:MAG: LysR family transcriptional regulator [Actinobacteria bacterium]|nr:LysR family transcriptional regulator [Actinomycetota bacterium]MCA1807128.1 LysR family transcriptional regulator [Actinomycetota bacterium]
MGDQPYEHLIKHTKTQRQAQVLEALINTGSVNGAAKELKVSSRTVRRHLKTMQERHDERVNFKIGLWAIIVIIVFVTALMVYLFT